MLKAGDVDPATGKPVPYYHDPMVPGQRFDAPAKSPFMDMMLVPVYGGTGGDDQGTVTVSPRIQQNLGVRTAEVVEGVLQPMVSAVGSIAWNERDQSVVQARATGYIEKLYVRATLDRVRAGQPFANLYVPEWVAAQEEYLAVRRFAPGDAGLIAAARQRLLLAGMGEAQVARVDAAGAVQPRITLVAPSSGVVAELIAREGMTVAPGMLLARINGLASVWANAELPESQAALVRPGSRVEARSPGVPGAVFRGTVQALLPEVNPGTRTLKACVQFANPDVQLVPGLFVTMQFVEGMADRTSIVACATISIECKRLCGWLARSDFRRRSAFSTPTTASSTRPPMAMARPPSVIVLIDRPKYLKTSAVMKIDTGIVVSAMMVGRKARQTLSRLDHGCGPCEPSRFTSLHLVSKKSPLRVGAPLASGVR